MAGIDATIPLGAKVPDGMATIGSMVGLARGAQELQLRNVELQKNEIALAERKGVQDLFANADSFKGDDGQIDWNRFISAGMKVAPTTFPTMIPQVIQANRFGTEAKQALLNLHESERGAAGQWMLAQRGRSVDDIAREADEVKKLNPSLAPALDSSLNLLRVASATGQKAVDASLTRLGAAAMPPPAQVQAMQPSGPVTDSGQVTQQINTNPMAGATGVPVVGTVTQKQLPPTTPTFDESSGRPGYVGPQGMDHGTPSTQVPPEVQANRDAFRKRAIQNEIDNLAKQPDSPQKRDAMAALNTEMGAMQPKRPFVASGPKLGTEANVAGTVDAVNKDWGSTTESAKTAAQDIGVLQNIKKYARGAVTGVAGDRRAYAAGLAGLLGMDAAQLEKTDTDLLAKNSNMLALAGGDTNLAKLMAESANPNKHMTPEAIEGAANQVIAQRRLAIAKQTYMQHFKADPELYSKELANFNSFADPRILQLPDLSPQEKARMKAAMSPAEQREFGQKIRKMQAAGIVQ